MADRLGIVRDPNDEKFSQETKAPEDLFLGAITPDMWRLVYTQKQELQVVVAAQRGRDAVNAVLLALTLPEGRKEKMVLHGLVDDVELMSNPRITKAQRAAVLAIDPDLNGRIEISPRPRRLSKEDAIRLLPPAAAAALCSMVWPDPVPERKTA